MVAADDCRFSQLEPMRGIHAAGGATMRFVDRGGWGNAMYHLLTSDEFDATEAHRIGLVQEVVPAGTQLERAIEIAEVICTTAPLAILTRGGVVPPHNVTDTPTPVPKGARPQTQGLAALAVWIQIGP